MTALLPLAGRKDNPVDGTAKLRSFAPEVEPKSPRTRGPVGRWGRLIHCDQDLFTILAAAFDALEFSS
jgi:hypothetical protein